MGTCLGFVRWFERPRPSIGESLGTAANKGGVLEVEAAYLAITRERDRQRCGENGAQKFVVGHGDLLGEREWLTAMLRSRNMPRNQRIFRPLLLRRKP
jgi:hypothetical protein